LRTWALSAGLSLIAGCSAVEIDPYVLPAGKLSEKQRKSVEYVLADVAVAVPLDVEEVKSRIEIYHFLLDEMPFTGGVVRELGRGKWKITRDPENPAAFTVSDPAGYRIRFELVLREPERRAYVTKGVFQMGILPALEGDSLVVIRMRPEGPVIKTDAMVYVRVVTPFYAQLAKGMRGMVEDAVRERSSVFVRSAKWVAEEAASRPEWLVEQVDGSREVDQAVLAEFRKRFLSGTK
jgi:hypothetical protein